MKLQNDMYIAFTIPLVLLIVILLVAATRAQPREPVWVQETCFTNSCIAATLNRLTPDRAHEAKLTTYGHATYVWYRQ